MCAEHRCVALLVVTLLLPFSLSYPADGTTIGFQAAVNYPVGTAPRAVAAGDFNGDGKVDLAVANAGGSVSILLGNGDCTFQPANNIPVGKNPLSIAVGDFNGDSRLDLVVADIGSDTAGVLLGNGDGTFRASVGYATGVGPTSIAVGDFDGDSRLDLVVANNGSSTVSLLLGNGDGTFEPRVDYSGSGRVNSVAVADFNGDGKEDLAVAGGSSSGMVAILLGNGDGTFQSAVSYDTSGPLGFSVAVGDFNGDGKLDLLVSHANRNVTASSVDMLPGNGDGTFSFGSTPTTDVCKNSYPIAADFDGDGKLDLAVMGGFSFEDGVCAGHHLDVLVLAGNGDGTLQAPAIFTATDAANLILGAASFDLNGDKSPDLVTVNSDNTLSVLLNGTGADFSISTSAPNPGTVSRGQSSTSIVTLSHLNAFDNPVALTCLVLPSHSAPTCSLNPNSVTFDANGNATAMLTINTGAATASLVPASLRHDSRPLHFLWLPVAGFALIGAGFGSSRPTRRRLTVYLLGGILFGGLISQEACGGGSSGPGSTTYAITVTGTSGSTQHSATTTLTVQ